jgi:hypothetical protein
MKKPSGISASNRYSIAAIVEVQLCDGKVDIIDSRLHGENACEQILRGLMSI